ncbi:MAG: murein transglycosylase A, partial [Candidatus Binatia bacterium]
AMSSRAALAFLLAPVISCTSGVSCFRWSGSASPEVREAAPEPPEAQAPAPLEIEPSPEPVDLVEVGAEDLPEMTDDLDRASLAEAIERNLAYLASRPGGENVGLGGAACSVAELRGALEDFREVLLAGGDAGTYASARFRVFRSTGRTGGPLVTGYYEPFLEARRRREEPFVHPIFRRPDDLLEIRLADFTAGASRSTIVGRVSGGKLEPYPSRREIDGEGALDGRGLELAWLADPVARFFLHVQGSGILRLDDGSELRIGYAASNGRGYTSIGRVLLEEGALGRGESTAPGIQRYLREHPERIDDVLFANERYIFFREVAEGPVGSLGVRLTPGRSIAADPTLVPPGALGYLVTRTPEIDERGEVSGFRPARRFVVSQDTGAAITGPGRVDLFFGTGDRAGLEAGNMAETADLYFLLPGVRS